MKRIVALALCALLLVAFALTGCAKQEPAEGTTAPEEETAAPVDESTPAPAVEDDPSVTALNLWSFTVEVEGMFPKFQELNPDFDLEINSTVIATTDGAYQPALDAALAAGGADAPDLYAAESAFVLKYTQGDAAEFAIPYKSLGIDVDALLEEAAIAPYTVDIGTRPSDGALVGLGYQATGGAFIYRRSLATDTWGTDDPAEIKDIVGPGWDKFFAAAADLKEKGYGIVSGDGDIWHAVENGSEKGWVVDGALYIDPQREAFLDLSMQLKENDYYNDTQDWQDAWFADFRGEGPKEIFGFFGPAWLINYVMASNCGDDPETDEHEGTYGDWAICEPPVGFFWGGTWLIANKDTAIPASVGKFIQWVTLDSSDTALQYFWANGTLNGPGGTKDTVASGTVMAKSDGVLDFLGGQNMFDVFVPATEFATGTNKTQYDETINLYWRDQVRQYTSGAKTRDEALEAFKQQVRDNLDVVVD